MTVFSLISPELKDFTKWVISLWQPRKIIKAILAVPVIVIALLSWALLIPTLGWSWHIVDKLGKKLYKQDWD